MSDKVYNILKNAAQIWIPALATFWYTIAMIWNLPYAEPIMYTLIAVDTLLGTVLGISSAIYYKSQGENKDE